MKNTSTALPLLMKILLVPTIIVTSLLYAGYEPVEEPSPTDEMCQAELNDYYGNEAHQTELEMKAVMQEIIEVWAGTNDLPRILKAQEHFIAMRQLELDAAYRDSTGTVSGMCYSIMHQNMTRNRIDWLIDTWLTSPEIEGGGVNVCQPFPDPD